MLAVDRDRQVAIIAGYFLHGGHVMDADCSAVRRLLQEHEFPIDHVPGLVAVPVVRFAGVLGDLNPADVVRHAIGQRDFFRAACRQGRIGSHVFRGGQDKVQGLAQFVYFEQPLGGAIKDTRIDRLW